MTEFVDEIHNNLDHRVDPIEESFIIDLANNNPKKVMVHYLYDDSQGVSPVVQAVSTDPWIREDFVFVAVNKPTERMLTGKVKNLPII